MPDATLTLTDAIVAAAEVNNLVQKYGAAVVQHALDYLVNYPKPIDKGVIYKAIDKYNNENLGDISLTTEQHNKIKQIYTNGFQKIQAIKLFREFTGRPLRDAKCAIEWAAEQHLI